MQTGRFPNVIYTAKIKTFNCRFDEINGLMRLFKLNLPDDFADLLHNPSEKLISLSYS